MQAELAIAQQNFESLVIVANQIFGSDGGSSQKEVGTYSELAGIIGAMGGKVG